MIDKKTAAGPWRPGSLSPISSIFSTVAAGKQQSIDSHIDQFRQTASTSGSSSNIKIVHQSAITKVHSNVNWSIFEAIDYKAENIVYEFTPKRNDHLWNGLNIIVVDALNYRLPFSKGSKNSF